MSEENRFYDSDGRIDINQLYKLLDKFYSIEENSQLGEQLINSRNSHKLIRNMSQTFDIPYKELLEREVERFKRFCSREYNINFGNLKQPMKSRFKIRLKKAMLHYLTSYD